MSNHKKTKKDGEQEQQFSNDHASISETSKWGQKVVAELIKEEIMAMVEKGLDLELLATITNKEGAEAAARYFRSFM